MAESLDKKARTGSRWYHYIGGLALTAALAGGAVCLHNKGVDTGYKQGKKESSAEERKAGVEEGRRMRLNENPSFGWFEGDEIYASFTRSVSDTGRVTYTLSLNGFIGTAEAVRIEQPDRSAVSYLDCDFDFTRDGAPDALHDGLVDMITFTDSDGYSGFKFRHLHYAGNEELFDNADKILKDMKGFFSGML